MRAGNSGGWQQQPAGWAAECECKPLLLASSLAHTRCAHHALNPLLSSCAPPCRDAVQRHQLLLPARAAGQEVRAAVPRGGRTGELRWNHCGADAPHTLQALVAAVWWWCSSRTCVVLQCPAHRAHLLGVCSRLLTPLAPLPPALPRWTTSCASRPRSASCPWSGSRRCSALCSATRRRSVRRTRRRCATWSSASTTVRGRTALAILLAVGCSQHRSSLVHWHRSGGAATIVETCKH